MEANFMTGAQLFAISEVHTDDVPKGLKKEAIFSPEA